MPHRFPADLWAMVAKELKISWGANRLVVLGTNTVCCWASLLGTFGNANPFIFSSLFLFTSILLRVHTQHAMDNL